jgi:hypothetical protein
VNDVFPTFRKCWNGSLVHDLLHGSTWQADLRESGLPAEVTILISATVKKSRLWRSEKASVTRELIAHFQDGVQSGQSYSKLNQEFGDPAVTAELIRRAKIRNRSMLMKVFRVTGLGIAALLSIYVLVSSYFYLGKPNPDVDYVVQLNPSFADVDENDKAWPIYRPLWTKYGFSEGGGFQIDEIHYRNPDDEDDGRLIRPTDPGWQAAVEALSQYEDLLDAFRRGARLPFLGIELQSDPRNYSDEDFAAILPGREKAAVDNSQFKDEEVDELMRGSTVSVLLPHVQVLRSAARMFAVDTRIAVQQGDTERAVDDLKTIFGLAHQAAEGKVLVCSLVGIAAAGIGFNELEQVLVQNPEFFSPGQLADLQSHLERISVRDWVHLEGERAMLHDMIQRIYTDDGHGDGRMTPQGVKLLATLANWWSIYPDGEEFGFEMLKTAKQVVAPATLFLCASRKEMTEKGDQLIDRVIADFDKAYWDPDRPDSDQYLKDVLEENPIKYHLLNLMFPATGQIRNAMDRTIGRQEGVIAALAIQRYYLKYGSWPQDYADVSPEFVTEFPIDQVNGALLNFKCDENGPLIYSVGNDRDDDGGQDPVYNTPMFFEGQKMPRAQFNFGPKRDDPDGDWIVWPQNDENW